MDDIKYGDYKTTIKIRKGEEKILNSISWKEKIAATVIRIMKELQAEGLPIATVPGEVSVTLKVEKWDDEEMSSL